VSGLVSLLADAPNPALCPHRRCASHITTGGALALVLVAIVVIVLVLAMTAGLIHRRRRRRRVARG
jgi:heme/copper-type cytochrome/quinol oxidase subunit 2